MKADTWREGGEVVREQGRRFLSEYAKNHLSRQEDGADSILDVPVAWLAVGFVSDYDPSRFVERRVSRQELDVLCSGLLDYYENTSGRPRDDVSRAAATISCYFYEAWRNQNQKLGINDYGHRREMKDYAARSVVEDMFAWCLGFPKYAWRLGEITDIESYIEVVRGLMEKPKSRRDPGRGAELHFWATKAGLEIPPKPI
jgi:hypothetical protein